MIRNALQDAVFAVIDAEHSGSAQQPHICHGSQFALRLRGRRFEGTVKPALFIVPFGPVIPVTAIAIAAVILAGATREQLMAGAYAAGLPLAQQMTARRLLAAR